LSVADRAGVDALYRDVAEHIRAEERREDGRSEMLE
jgi:hypothetical protein